MSKAKLIQHAESAYIEDMRKNYTVVYKIIDALTLDDILYSTLIKHFF